MSKKLRISIIEDTKTVRDSLVKFFEFHKEDFELGLVVGSVEDYFHETSKFGTKDSEILLLDIGLPGQSGLEALPRIRTEAPQQDVIILSSYEEEDKILKALCSGACGYISKKASLQEILNALKIVAEGGSYMSPTIAREIVNHFMGSSKKTESKFQSILSARQIEIINYLMDGKSYGEIAKKLFISVETVRSHIKKMYRTLEVNNKAEAIAKYLNG